MDRLICGDVGYGKTEVALRAAFKAVLDGKQVAILVPTTILAQQHFQTFSERLRPFPVNYPTFQKRYEVAHSGRDAQWLYRDAKRSCLPSEKSLKAISVDAIFTTSTSLKRN